MSHANETLTHRWFEEVWSKGRSEAIDEMFASDGIAHGLGEENLRGPEEFKAFHARFIGAFPDMTITVEETICNGDKVAARFSGIATHTGDHLGVPATHRQVKFSGMSFIQWHDGKIAEGWNEVDMLGLFKQIGIV